jgi:hypothetical protein
MVVLEIPKYRSWHGARKGRGVWRGGTPLASLPASYAGPWGGRQYSLTAPHFFISEGMSFAARSVFGDWTSLIV